MASAPASGRQAGLPLVTMRVYTDYGPCTSAHSRRLTSIVHMRPMSLSTYPLQVENRDLDATQRESTHPSSLTGSSLALISNRRSCPKNVY